LGANGAGKSTTIRILLDFLRASNGTAEILGKDSVKDGVELKKEIGYLAGEVTLPKKVTGRQLLAYLAGLHGGVDMSYLAELEQRFDAELDKRTDTLSRGNRQKIGIIQAFMHKPSVLVLDEPTSGLDPLKQGQFYKTVEEAKARGATVFLSSHSFAEVERICDRVGIIRNGKLVHEGPIDRILKRRLPTWQIVLAQAADAEKLVRSNVLNILEHRGKLLTVRPAKSIAPALDALSKVDIVSITIHQDDLEDEFMIFYHDGGAA
jgi:ABC-2 type transport system ATP-binding protein